MRFADEVSISEADKTNIMQGDVDFEDATESCWNLTLNVAQHENSTDKQIDISRLTNKKKQYL